MVAMVNFARVMFAPLLVEIIAVFDVGEGTAGLVATMVWLGSALPRIPTGYLLTRFSRFRLVLGAGSVLTVAAAFTASADSILTLGAGALLMGLASGVYYPSAGPFISELFPDRVGRMVGIHGTAAQLSAVAAAPVVTLLLTVFLTWRAAFVVVAVAAFVSTLFVFVTGRRTDLPAAGGEDRDLWGAARREWKVVLLGIVVMGATGFVWQGLLNFYELYMLTKGVPETIARNMLTVVFAAGVPAFVVSGHLVDRLPSVPYILLVMTSFVLTVGALIAASGTLVLVVLTAVVGYVVHSSFPALDTFMLNSLPDHSRGSAYAVYSGGMMFVAASGSSAVGMLVESGLSFDFVFGGLALGLAVVVVGLIVGQRVGSLPS
jgi:predicted MFS family arabinose efflux permease